MENRKEPAGLCLRVDPNPGSHYEEWREDGLGNPKGIVDAFVNMFSSLLQNNGLGVYPKELHCWLDIYYTLRAAAESHAARKRAFDAMLKSSDSLGFKAVEDEFKLDEDMKQSIKNALDEATKALERMFSTEAEEE